MAKKKTTSSITIDWESIIGTIKSGKCVFLIGPEILSDPTSTYQDKLLDFLTRNLKLKDKENFVQYYRRHQLFEFSDDTEQGLVYQKMQLFYRTFEKADIFQKIASISIPLIITLNPDLNLKKAFEKYAHQFLYYNKKPLQDSTGNKLHKDNPLVYNLFGTIELPETIIFTYDDLLNYIFNLLGKSPDLPLSVRNTLSEAQLFLFLGFKFEQWYMQLIVRILTMQGDIKGKIKYAFDKASYTKETYLFYADHFNVNFLELSPEQFVNELSERCLVEGQTRKPLESNGIDNPIARISQLLENDELDEALNLFKKFLKELGENFDDEYESSILLYGRLKNLLRNEVEGVLAFEDVQIERSKIRKSCREMLKTIEQKNRPQ